MTASASPDTTSPPAEVSFDVSIRDCWLAWWTRWLPRWGRRRCWDALRRPPDLPSPFFSGGAVVLVPVVAVVVLDLVCSPEPPAPPRPRRRERFRRLGLE